MYWEIKWHFKKKLCLPVRDLITWESLNRFPWNTICNLISSDLDCRLYSIPGGNGWLGFPDLLSGQKPLMELIFNPCGEFRWSPEGPVSQIHSPHLHADAPGIFSVLLSSVLMLKRESGCGKQRETTTLIHP